MEIEVRVVAVDVVGQQVILTATELLNKKEATARKNLVCNLVHLSHHSHTFSSYSHISKLVLRYFLLFTSHFTPPPLPFPVSKVKSYYKLDSNDLVYVHNVIYFPFAFLTSVCVWFD